VFERVNLGVAKFRQSFFLMACFFQLDFQCKLPLISAMKRILIVEDDLAIQDIFKIIFETYGYEVECMDNGKTLCEKDTNWPDAIILDKQLPGVDGVEACRHLKSQATTKNIPVILITASSGIVQAARIAGADDFAEKPFDMKSIVKKVETLIDKRPLPIL
jgi:DNA-binding response OmpR family regulator